MTGENQKALEALDKLVFSDGAGAVCAWVNEHQATIRKALSEPDASGDGKAVELLEYLYSKWENGDPCIDEDGDNFGNAFQLDADTEAEILKIIPRTASEACKKRAMKATHSPQPEPGEVAGLVEALEKIAALKETDKLERNEWDDGYDAAIYTAKSIAEEALSTRKSNPMVEEGLVYSLEKIIAAQDTLKQMFLAERGRDDIYHHIKYVRSLIGELLDKSISAHKSRVKEG